MCPGQFKALYLYFSHLIFKITLQGRGHLSSHSTDEEAEVNIGFVDWPKATQSLIPAIKLEFEFQQCNFKPVLFLFLKFLFTLERKNRKGVGRRVGSERSRLSSEQEPISGTLPEP